MKKQPAPNRLVKLLLPVDLVRQMDRAILASEGTYQDRNEFVAESIRDRLTEEAALAASERGAPKGIAHQVDASGAGPVPVLDEVRDQRPSPDTEPAPGVQLQLGGWRRQAICTVPARPSDQVNFGLHNRDLPTLWVLNRLATMAGGTPVNWSQFIAVLRQESAAVGEHLRLHDVTYATPIQVGTGFPKSGAKKDQSIDRFVAAMVGSQRRSDGPLFALTLADFADPDRQEVAPTDAAVETLGDMLDLGLGTDLPQPGPAFERWWRHLSEWAPAEHTAWRKVLHAVAGNPTRNELVARFPEWPGNTADTNTAGFISRSREWGLVQPEQIDGRYQMTDLGAAVAQKG